MMDRKLVERFSYILGGALIGSATTYLLVRQALMEKYRDIAEAEIASVKESYDLLNKQGPYSDPKKAMERFKELESQVDKYEDMIDENGYFREEILDANEETTEEAPVVRPPMPDGRPDPMTVVESVTDDRPKPARHEGSDTPYVVTVNEFMQDREEFEKITVTYYEYDNTLASEDDTIVDNHDRLVGQEFPNYVGWESGSDNVVYVRNERISSDFEILVNPNGYEAEVLGIIPDGHPKKKMLQMRNNE